MNFWSHAAPAFLTATGLLAVGPVAAAIAQQAGGQAAVDTESPWRVEFNSWVWLMGVSGDAGVGGHSADLSASFIDVLDASDSLAAFSGHLEVGYDRWALFLDGFYADIGADNVSGPGGLLDIDVTMEQAILDFGAMYRVGQWEPSGSAASNAWDITLDLYAGGRYTDLKLELDPANAESRARGESWLDPIFGVKTVLPVSERWRFSLNGDVGGFGVESDLTWSTTAVVGYDFLLFDLPATMYGGYRAIGWDYSEGTGPTGFSWDVINHGPMLGFGLRF